MRQWRMMVTVHLNLSVGAVASYCANLFQCQEYLKHGRNPLSDDIIVYAYSGPCFHDIMTFHQDTHSNLNPCCQTSY